MCEQWGEQQRSLCPGNPGWLRWGELGWTLPVLAPVWQCGLKAPTWVLRREMFMLHHQEIKQVHFWDA